MPGKLCLPIRFETCEKVLSYLKTYASSDSSKTNELLQYDFFEIWIDYITDFSAAWLEKLLLQYPNQLILVFRRLNLEEPQIPEAKRYELMQQFSNSACLIDIDISTQKKLLYKLYQENSPSNLLISYHNYEMTPDTEQLIALSMEMVKYKPKILKICSFCNSDSDAVKLIVLLNYLKNQQLKAIVLGMGEHGLITRIAGQLVGNEFLFVVEEKNLATAPGQLSRMQISKIMEVIANAG